MTKTTHTPGPWVAMPWFNHQRAPICTRDESGTVTLIVATVEDFHDSPDARLIAASPTMYDYIADRANEGDKLAKAIIASIGND